MAVDGTKSDTVLDHLVKSQLKPFVKKIDAEAYYAVGYLQALGESGFLQSQHISVTDMLLNESRLVEETAKTCMTTAFNLWCHLAVLTYLRNCDNPYLRSEILPLLENGERLGGTGLSNPMKYYAGMEKLNLKAKRTEGGYLVSGQLGAVSNLGPDHWFGIIAEVKEEQRVMALVSCNVEGLLLKEKADYLGLNGSATYSCQFSDVFIPQDWVISEQADSFVKKVRSAFVVYQVPLGLGVTDESIRAIEKVRNRQSGCNSYLNIQADELERDFVALRQRFYELIQSPDFSNSWEKLLEIRLDVAYLTLKAVHGCMLHQGSAAYLQNSDASRRLREAYFLANLTPTVKHLEKLLHC
jgi:hypothetical protein